MACASSSSSLRVVIFLNNHLPAHVHVFGDGEAKIDLLGVDGAPALVWADNMTHSEIRRTLRLVSARQDFLIKQWEAIRERSARSRDL
jgi:hypothetical protein